MNPILGTMNIEYPYTSSDNTITSYKKIIQEYYNKIDDPILDTAYYYGNTKTEYILGIILDELDKKPKIASKANPWFENDFTTGIQGQLSPDNLEKQLNISLKNLKLDNIDLYFLHAPDHLTPIKLTLEKCDELWRKEKFNYLGLSNYSKDQISNIINLSDEFSINKPKYYQGMYNLLARNVEEIFPIIRENDIEFWAYNPLAGGLLTGKYKNNSFNDNSRFKNNQIYQNIYCSPNILNSVIEFNNFNNCIDIAYSWLINYSKLNKKDRIIIGVSTDEQLINNIDTIKKKYNIDNQLLYKLNNLYNKNYSPNYYY